jgi:hypothetical protein
MESDFGGDAASPRCCFSDRTPEYTLPAISLATIKTAGALTPTVADVVAAGVNCATIGATAREGGGFPPARTATVRVAAKPQAQTNAPHFPQQDLMLIMADR